MAATTATMGATKATTACLNISSSYPPFHRTPSLCSRSISHFSSPLLHFKCGKEAAEWEYENSSSTSSSSESPPSSATVDCDDHTSISACRWCTGLGGVGFLETAYLTYLKLRNTDAFCPMGGRSCTTILTTWKRPKYHILKLTSPGSRVLLQTPLQHIYTLLGQSCMALSGVPIARIRKRGKVSYIGSILQSWILGATCNPWSLMQAWEEFQELRRGIRLQVVHQFREGNFIADFSAKQGADGSTVYYDNAADLPK